MRHRFSEGNPSLDHPITSRTDQWEFDDPEETLVTSSNTAYYSGKLNNRSSDLYDMSTGRRRRSSSVLVTNPCIHTKVESIPEGTTLDLDNDVGNSAYRRSYSGPLGTPYLVMSPVRDLATYPAALGSANEFTATDWTSLSAKFFEAYDSFVSPQLLVGEDIVEHQVFKEAFLTVLNPTRAIRNLVKVLNPLRIKGKTPMGAVVDIARGASSQVLAYNFAVKPAIKDLKSALGAHSYVKNRLDYLRQNRGQYVRVGAVARAMASVSPYEPDESYPYAHVFASISNRYKESRIGGWGRVRDDINHKGDWAAYMQYFGIQHIVGLAWELIPYSFLIDWVTNAQARIRNLTRLRFGGPFSELTGLSCSEKTTDVVQVRLHPGWANGISAYVRGPKSQLVGYRNSVVYWRTLLPPESSSFLNIPEVKSFQLLTGSALIIQNLTS